MRRTAENFGDEVSHDSRMARIHMCKQGRKQMILGNSLIKNGTQVLECRQAAGPFIKRGNFIVIHWSFTAFTDVCL